MAKKRDWSKELFAKPGGKDDFFTLKGRMAGIFGGGSKKGHRASLNISGAGRPERGSPQIAGMGRASHDVPDLGGRKRDRSKKRVPDIGAARAQKVSRTVPDIGGSGPTSKGTPSLGGPPRGRSGRRKDRIPGIGAMGKGSRDAPAIGTGGPGTPDISAAVGAKSGGAKGRGGYRGRAMRGIAAYAGFRSLSDDETAELELFYARAISSGFKMEMPERSRFRAQIMLGNLAAADLWKTDIGSEIERRYGRRGEDLDLPEADRPKRGFVEEKEEVKEAGVKPSTRNFFQRIIQRVRRR